MYNRQPKNVTLFFRYGGKWWEMVGKWWENGGKMVGISTQTYEDTF